MRRPSCGECLALLLLILAPPNAGAALLAIDLGSDFIKAALVKPGRAPVSIVLNEMSKRKTPAQVAFVDGDRLLGDEAASVAARHPERVLLGARDLLGRFANDTGVAEILQRRALPFDVVADPDRGTVRFRMGTNTSYAVEEVVASILHYARQLAVAAAEGLDVVDCAITVPAFWGQNQRIALQDAAQLAGLNVLGLVNTHAAAALQYGIERDFTETPQHVVLYDMGASSVEAALVEFSTYSIKEGSTVNTYGQFVVKDVAWDAQCGGEDLERALIDHLAAEFKAKHGTDVRTVPRALAKLRKQVKRLKEVLSANTEAPMSVEELHDGVDFRATVSRSQLEELAGDFWAKATAPLKTLLTRNNVKPESLAAVELLGGGSRVPRLKAALQEALGGRALDMHLDADEAVVFGAGLFVANQSTTFRLRKFGMTDGVLYPVTLQLQGEAAPKPLLPAAKRLPVKRVVHLPHPLPEPLEMELRFAEGVPPGMPDALLARLSVSGLEEGVKSFNDTGSVKVDAHFRADVGAVLALDKVEALVEHVVMVTTKVPKTNVTDDEASAEEDKASDEAKGNNTEPARPPKAIEYETVTVPKTKVAKVTLTVGGGWVLPGMTPEQLRASRSVMTDMRRRDEAKREAAKAKNDLEGYIITAREKLGDDSPWVQVTTETQRSEFATALSDAEDWLYADGEAEGSTAFRKKLKSLTALGEAIQLRVREKEARPAAVESAHKWAGITKLTIKTWETTKPWINATDKDALLGKFEEFEAWLTEAVAAQDKLAAHEPPSLTSSMVAAKRQELQRAFQRLNNTRKPKEPKKKEAPGKEPPGGDRSTDVDGGHDEL